MPTFWPRDRRAVIHWWSARPHRPGTPRKEERFGSSLIPTESDWTVIVNASTSQWGHESRYTEHESRYTEEVRAQDVGRATVASERLQEMIEMFTIRSRGTGANSAELVSEWQDVRVRPVTARR